MSHSRGALRGRSGAEPRLRERNSVCMAGSVTKGPPSGQLGGTACVSEMPRESGRGARAPRILRPAMAYSAAFRCVAGCPGRWPVTQVIYHCPQCGGLLEVSHDVAALRDRSAAAWMKLFEQRYKTTQWPHGSGVWGKKEWVMPDLRDENIVSMDEGGSNLFWAERYGKSLGLEELWIKLCGNSHTG